MVPETYAIFQQQQKIKTETKQKKTKSNKLKKYEKSKTVDNFEILTKYVLSLKVQYSLKNKPIPY